ncbi:helix-turn-helix domain-containing protein [Wukongibacter sp. M2B1]|uniref:helix-turn-helix domain-containing protein n=1 Tax=Wukongibacter sp. M2B1 TaxID=3088895 RepID=UPI003D7AA2CE
MNKLRDKRKKNWFYLENALVDREDLSSNEKLIYMALARYANEDDEAFPSYNTISKKTSLGKRTIINGVKSLVEKGLVKKTIRFKNSKENNSNLYTLFSVELPSEIYAPPSASVTPPSEMIAPPPSASVTPPSAPVAPKKDLNKNTNIIKNTNLKNKTSTQIENLRIRYSEDQLKTIDDYIDILRWTRKHGKIADSVILKIYEEWDKFKTSVVIYALKVYVENPNHHDKKENYCYGIMRNATAEQVAGKSQDSKSKTHKTPKRKNNKFNKGADRISQQYTNEELEKKLGLRK